MNLGHTHKTWALTFHFGWWVGGQRKNYRSAANKVLCSRMTNSYFAHLNLFRNTIVKRPGYQQPSKCINGCFQCDSEIWEGWQDSVIGPLKEPENPFFFLSWLEVKNRFFDWTVCRATVESKMHGKYSKTSLLRLAEIHQNQVVTKKGYSRESSLFSF